MPKLIRDPKLSQGISPAYKAYKQNIGPLTTKLIEEIYDLITEFGTLWFIEATEVAANNETRELSYIKSILFDWKINGHENP